MQHIQYSHILCRVLCKLCTFVVCRTKQRLQLLKSSFHLKRVTYEYWLANVRFFASDLNMEYIWGRSPLCALMLFLYLLSVPCFTSNISKIPPPPIVRGNVLRCT